MIATAKRQVTVFLGLLMLLGIGTRVLADTGVSDERVVLPDGPGSIGGVGENAEIDPNMGMMRYSIKIETPAGFNKVTPSLSLSYGSGSGSSVLGIGWSMSLPHIERMSLRGLPEYGTDDEFAVNGSDELVEVGTDGTTLIFRNRFEKGFIRYKWHEPGDGKGGYFTAEYPDGTVSYFGADQEGDDVATSRVSTADGGVFRYHLVETVDPYGHRISYTYVKHGDFAVIDEIGYVFTGGATPRFSVKFTYEDREDVLSDCVPGFNLLLTKRMSGIQVLSGATQVKRYALTYEEYTKSGGFTRLAAVKQYGVEDELHPINFSFGYSRSLGGACESDCEGPYMVDMGTLPGGVDISTGRATLLDINGDALPDVLNTTNEGIHSFYISEIGTDGNPGFTDTVVESTSTTSGSSFVLNAPGVQVLDVNGDGFTDIISSRVGDVLCNTGAGDWTGTDCIANSTLPQMDEDGEGDANPLHVRFMDYDNDKRIDMIRTNYGSTEVFHNTGGAFTSTLVDEMGAVFDDSTLQLTDMNGDNLQDPVEILAGGQIRYKLNLGFGKWTDWVEVTLSGIGESALLNAKLEDINGDSLSDIVVVLANEVSYSINRNGTSFDPFVTLTSDEVTGDVPENNAETSVLFADMNGNGSRDIVWITNGGAVKFLELFPVKPNLISRISNGIGSEQLIEYGTSVAQQARDKINAPWQYKLPYAMNLVIASDQWVTLTGDDDGQGLHSRVEYVYHDGYYDGAEKTFRGYEDVEVFELADMTQDSQEPGLAMMHYDVGASDPYYNGLLLSKNIFAGEEGSRRELERQTTEYEDCEVAGVPTSGLRLDVRHVCEIANQIVIIEGSTDNKEWVTKRTELGYDGYGNANQKSALGVIHYGPPDSPVACVACGSGDDFGTPCGASCTGDEFYTEIDFVEPGEDTGGLWLLGSQYRKVTYGSADGPKSETLTYYDGEAYQGLTLGTMTKGLISSVSQKEEEGKEELIYSARSDYDEHGNIVEIIDSNGSIANTTSHRRQYTLDSLGLSVTRVEILLEDKEGEAYRLRQDVEYEEVFRKPSKSTSWMLVKGGTAVSDANPSKYRYDNQGRTVKIIRPGDTAAAPSMEYDYDLGDPSSRVVVNMRSAAGGAADLEEVRCFDGKGREFQRRTKLKSGLYQVNGFVTFNKRGAQVRQYQPYQGTTSACDTEPPNDVLYTSFRFDAAHRNIQTTDPDADIYGEASVSRTVYKPLTTLVYDAEDNLADSWAYNTPIVSRTDGLGRLLSIERYLGDMDSGGEAATVEVHYDTLGRISGFTDPMGHRHTQTLDLLGRTVAVDSTNTGTTTYKHDAMGNVLESTDARGETVVSVYDGMNRLVANYNAASPTDTRSEWTFDQAEDCSSCTNVVGKAARTTYPLGGDRGLGIDEAGFDAKGRLIYNARTLEGNKFETGLAYDNANRLTKTTFSDGNEFDYTYDAASRLNGIDGILHQIDFNEKGLLSEITFIEGTKNKRVYDSAMRLSSITSTSSSDTVLQGFEFTRNRLGAVLNLTDTSDAREGRPTFDANYAYDTWNRVIEASIDPGKSTAEVISLTYDVMDNLLSKTSSLGSSSRADVGDYSYDFADHPNAVSKAGDITFDYDASGNMTGRGDKDLTWDYQGRMTNVSSDNGSPGEFVYGPNHQRVMKLEEGGVTYYITPQFEVRDGIGTAYAKVGRTKVSRSQTSNLQTKIYGDIAPLDAADGLITAADAWVAHAVAEGIVEKSGLADGDGGRLLRAAARRLLLEEGDDLVFFHHDHLGSLTLATNGFAEVVGETAYYPSGEKRVSNGYIDEYGFTGQGLDASSGLTHFEYRYLDTGVGRWASADPAFHNVTGKTIRRLGESTTAYAYVSGNWTNVVDPLGLTEDGKGGGGNKTTDNGGGSSNKQSVPTSSRVRTARKNAVTSVKAGKKNVMNQVSKVKKTKAVKAATHWKKSATSGAFSVASGTVRVGVGIVTADVGGIFDGAISIGSGIVGVAGAAQDRSLNVNHGVSDLSGTEVTQSKLTKGLKYTGWALTAVGVGLTVAALTGVTLGAAPICVAAVSLAVAAFKLWSHRRDVKNSKGNLHGRQNSISQSESSASIASAQGSGVSFGYDYE